MSGEGQSLRSEDVEALLGRLCVELGFCLSSPQHDELCDNPPESAALFTDAVINAEGLDAATIDRALHKQIHARVVEAYQNAQAQADLDRQLESRK